MIESQAEEAAVQNSKISEEAVISFGNRAAATGAILDSSEDCQAAQRVINYCKAEPVADCRKASVDSVAIKLARFQPAFLEAVFSDEAGATGYSKDELRQYIRVRTFAGQWRCRLPA